MIRKSYSRVLLAVADCLGMGDCFATYSCAGIVYGVVVRPYGIVSTEYLAGASWSHWCNLTTTDNGVSPDTCKGILALLLSAEAQGKQGACLVRRQSTLPGLDLHRL